MNNPKKAGVTCGGAMVLQMDAVCLRACAVTAWVFFQVTPLSLIIFTTYALFLVIIFQAVTLT